MSGRTRIADRSSDDTPYGHLLPVLEAELAWGNSTRSGFVRTEQDGAWSAQLREPLHVERLLAEFNFPEHIRVRRRDDGATSVSDIRHWVFVSAPPPTPPRAPRSGLLARVLGP